MSLLTWSLFTSFIITYYFVVVFVAFITKFTVTIFEVSEKCFHFICNQIISVYPLDQLMLPLQNDGFSTCNSIQSLYNSRIREKVQGKSISWTIFCFFNANSSSECLIFIDLCFLWICYCYNVQNVLLQIFLSLSHVPLLLLLICFCPLLYWFLFSIIDDVVFCPCLMHHVLSGHMIVSKSCTVPLYSQSKVSQS